MSTSALALLVAVVAQAEVTAETAATLQAQATPQTEATEQAQPLEPRPYHEITREMRAALRAEATAESLAEREAPIRQLAALHDELIADPRLARSETLTSRRALIYSRLVRVQDDIERQLARDRVDSDRAGGERADCGRTTGANNTSSAAAPSGTSPCDTLAADSPSTDPLDGAHGGGVGPVDLGEELVELIQHTISPEHWDVNGGPGAIVYYAPLKVLVVRASGEVHGNVRDLNNALREAGN